MPPRTAPGGSQRGGRGGGGSGGGDGGRGASPSDRGGRGRGGGPRGGGPRGGGPRGGGPGGSRGASPARGGAPGSGTSAASLPASHITTVGVKRPSYGTAGRPIAVYTNFFRTSIPETMIYHYDVVISPSEKTLPARLNLEIIRKMQEDTAPEIFTPPGVYDGRKNFFSSHALSFGQSREFEVYTNGQRGSPPEQGAATRAGPRPHKVRLTKVAEINAEVMSRFIQGQQSHDNTVLTAITALNVVIRMEPTMRYPFNVRSFFTDRETRDIGNGYVLWRGYFQSARPGIGQMLINVDISTGVMYKAGPLISVILEFLGKPQTNPGILANIPDRELQQLQRFFNHVRVLQINPDGQAPRRNIPRGINSITRHGAAALSFQTREGQMLTVAQYFQQQYNRPLRFPNLPCVELGRGALIPIELCTIVPGQIMRKQVPPEKTNDVLQFSTKKPQERLQSIRNGLGVLAYGQSAYVKQFGMHVDENAGPLKFNARVLDTPTLKYGQGSRQPTIRPSNGSWNMMDKKFYRPAAIDNWAIVVYERSNRFGQQQVDDLIKGLLASCRDCGITVVNQNPFVSWQNGQGRITEQLREVGNRARQQGGNKMPNLLVIILPDQGNDIYTQIKHFGDVAVGVATQCLKSSKCFRAKAQYYANVCLKINVKLGGINTIPDPSSVSILTDPKNPTVVMGADAIHPAPGSDGRPSFTAVVGNVDSDTAKYVADIKVQKSRQEIIEDLESMSHHVLDMYMKYRRGFEKKADFKPKRIIFYRDGVSEGQFSQVLDQELPLLKNACKSLGIDAKITFIVVGKRHHARFFPTNDRDGDRSGNLPAGTVVDREVVHPVEFDFYLLSHGGLLGTSRPAHYNVLYDENNFTPDGLQSLSFALTHVYARSTRSVSIPAPVYYADIVCSRAKNHYDPNVGGIEFSETATSLGSGAADASLENYKKNFKPLHINQRSLMYFS